MKTFREALYAPQGADARATISTSVVLATSILTPGPTANAVFLDVQTNPVMVTFDGSTPSATNGHQFSAGYNAIWSKAMWSAARFIRQGAADGVVQVIAVSN